MSLNLPDSADVVVQRAKTDVQREVVESNPFLKNSWLSALITGYGNRIFDFYLQLKEAVTQSLPDSATDGFLERWAAIWQISRNPATSGSGIIVATGSSGTTVPAGSLFVSSDGKIYASDVAADITSSSISVSSLTRVGSTATATTPSDHNLSDNVSVTIAGAVETEYNVLLADIKITGLNSFTYTVPGAPATPATGTVTASHVSIPIQVNGQDFGVLTNQVAATELKLQSPIVGVDDSANANFSGIVGGADQETDEQMRVRLLDRIQNPIAHFNVAEITSVAKTVPGVTRVFVHEITPVVGRVTVYFMRDDDDNPIPTAPAISDVNAVVQAIRPANTATSDVIVIAPLGVPVDFTFTALSPDTATMKTSITASLQQFFDEQPSVGVDVDSDAYRSAIFNTVDTVTGASVISFTLLDPSGDITILTGEIGTLGNTVYP